MQYIYAVLILFFLGAHAHGDHDDHDHVHGHHDDDDDDDKLLSLTTPEVPRSKMDANMWAMFMHFLGYVPAYCVTNFSLLSVFKERLSLLPLLIFYF